MNRPSAEFKSAKPFFPTCKKKNSFSKRGSRYYLCSLSTPLKNTAYTTTLENRLQENMQKYSKKNTTILKTNTWISSIKSTTNTYRNPMPEKRIKDIYQPNIQNISNEMMRGKYTMAIFQSIKRVNTPIRP